MEPLADAFTWSIKFDLQPVRWRVEVDHQLSAALPAVLSVDVWMDRDLLNPLPIHHHTPNSTESKQNGHPCQQAEMAARYLELRWELWYNSTSPANCLYQLVGLAVGRWLQHLPAALLLGYSVADIISR